MFINEDFMLQSDLAKELYKEVKELPIIDYHNHLDAKEIYENKAYENITDLWLEHDHYKWRLMRLSGIEESYITGNKSKEDKFLAFAKALEHAYLNPMYHWSHMELKEYFKETEILTSKNASTMYAKVNEYLKEYPKGPRDYLQHMNVEVICTTDDLLSDLKYHKKIALDNSINLKVLPTFRPDRLFNIQNDDFLDIINSLEESSKTTINNMDSLQNSLSERLDFFQANGCLVSDHGLSHFKYHKVSKEEVAHVLYKRINKETLSQLEIEQFRIFLLAYFVKEYSKRNMVTQFHVGAIRNTNQSMFETLGADSGFDSINNEPYIEDLNNFLSDLSYECELPKIVLYNLNSNDNEAMASLCGNFSKNKAGNIQLGAPWWFNDHHTGIINHLTTYSTYLNIDTFVGMLTDSRSYLSFVRHDYFRRILCDFIADKVNKGFIPNDLDSIVTLVKNISYYNSKRYILEQ